MPDLPLDSLPPATPKAMDVVSQKVYIEGIALPGEINLVQFTVNKSFNKIATAKLTLMDGAASKRDFLLSNDEKFKPGNKIKIQLGYHGKVDTVFQGIIVKHGIKAFRQGASVLTIEAKDEIILMTASRKSAYFPGKTDSEIITQVAKDNKVLNTTVDATTFKHPQLVQMDATDWDFIVSRAEANSMLVFTDDGKLIVKKPSTSSKPVLTATYGENIREFEAELDARRQLKTVKTHSWNFNDQKLDDSKEGSATLSEPIKSSSDELAKVLGADINLIHSGYLNKDQLDTWSDAYAMRSKISRASGRVRIFGNADVKPGTMVTLKGVGDRFNGNVFVTGILHHYESGWQTDIQFGWREEWFFRQDDFMTRPAGGLLPGINGLQIGVVLDVKDKADPKDNGTGQYRVKVYIPTITSTKLGLWARVAAIDAGPNRGVYFRPQVNDEVILGFLNDDPRDAVILGYLHSKQKNKIPFADPDAQEYGFLTKEGMKLSFDDTKKMVTLVAKTTNGEKSLTLNANGGTIEMKDEFTNIIKMDSTGITISTDNTLTLNGKLSVLINS